MKKQENIESKILKLFGTNVEKKFTFETILHFLPKKTRKEKLIHSLDILKRQNKLIEVDRFTFQLNPDKAGWKMVSEEKRVRKPLENSEKELKPTKDKVREKENKIVKPKSTIEEDDIFEGVLDITFSGAMFVTIEGFDRDPILKEREPKAMEGDVLKVKVLPFKQGKRPECKLIEVVERKPKKMIGKVHNTQTNGNENTFVLPVSIKLKNDFYISQHHTMNAKDGDYVIVELLDWYEKEKNPRGRIIEILNNYNPNEIEMQSILLERGFRQEFDEKVTSELTKVTGKISKSEIEKREDFRKIWTITIDPVDAKDFDDALSLQKLSNGNYEIGVHIADVSHYVKPNTEIDKEAYNRATSVYLPDRVAPMLPELLSNNLCSLRPNEDRLAFSVIYEVDENGKILHEHITRSVINSNKRLTYEDAQEVIETGKGIYAEEILILDKIAKLWRKDRYEKGAISFVSPEVRFKLDENAVPIEVYQKIQKDSNLLIEDYMLKANVSVAMFLEKCTKEKKIAAGVYREHDVPNIEKLEQFREAALRLGGHKLPKFESVEKAAHVLNSFLDSIQGNTEADILNQMAIRSMAKAYYSTQNIGHYGLAYDNYTHFTSPIRRYPDLLVHRLLGAILYDTKLVYTKEKLEEMCGHCSGQEKLATDCEREGIKLKQVEYLSTRIGEKFEGIISGMNQSGFWVEIIENKCEGFVELHTNFKEEFLYDPKNMTLKTNPPKIEFYYGDTLTIIVSKVDLETKKVWFTVF